MIYVMLADGFEEIEALAFVDILRRAKIDVKTVSVNETLTVNGAHGISVNADTIIDDVKYDGDAIVLPGGLPGTTNLQNDARVIRLINEYNANDKYIAAICAAPSVLGKLGLLKGKTATCYPSFEDKLEGALCSTERVVTDANVVTSRGAGTAHDFAFRFVEIFKDKQTADSIRSSMLYDA